MMLTGVDLLNAASAVPRWNLGRAWKATLVWNLTIAALLTTSADIALTYAPAALTGSVDSLEKILELEDVLHDLLAVVDVKSYLFPEQQSALRKARALLVKEGA